MAATVSESKVKKEREREKERNTTNVCSFLFLSAPKYGHNIPDNSKGHFGTIRDFK